MGRGGSGEGPAFLMPGGRAEQPSSCAALRACRVCQPTGRAGRMAASCALGLSAWRTRRPPAPEQPLTIYKARSLTWALEPWALGQKRSLSSHAADGNPEAQR